MDTYERRTNLGKKNLADSVAIYGRDREIFRPPTYYWFSNMMPHHARDFCLERYRRKWDDSNSNSASTFQPFACLGSQKLGPALWEHENTSDISEYSFFNRYHFFLPLRRLVRPRLNSAAHFLIVESEREESP
jgi:hypothetical protein